MHIYFYTALRGCSRGLICTLLCQVVFAADRRPQIYYRLRLSKLLNKRTVFLTPIRAFGTPRDSSEGHDSFMAITFKGSAVSVLPASGVVLLFKSGTVLKEQYQNLALQPSTMISSAKPL